MTGEPPDTQFELDEVMSSESLKCEYEQMVRDQCQRSGLHLQDLRIEALELKPSGNRQAYVVLVALKTNDALAALQLAHAAPVIERRVQETSRSMWLDDFSEFSGLWTRWPAAVQVPPELRALLYTRAEPTLDQ